MRPFFYTNTDRSGEKEEARRHSSPIWSNVLLAAGKRRRASSRGRAAVLSPPRGNPGRFSGGQPLGGPGLQGRRTGGAEHRLVTGCRVQPRPPVLPAWLRLFLPHPGWSRTGTGGRPTPGVKDAVRFVRRTCRRFTGTYKQEPNNRI